MPASSLRFLVSLAQNGSTDRPRLVRSAATMGLVAATICVLVTSLHVLHQKRLFSDEYVYSFISIGRIPGETFGDDPTHPSYDRFWSSYRRLGAVRVANHLESSNMFLYETALWGLINITRRTDTAVIGLVNVVAVWVAGAILYFIVVSLVSDRLCGLVAFTLFIAHPVVFAREVDMRGYALGLMFTQIALYLSLVAIRQRRTAPWQDLLFAAAATGAVFSSYNTASVILICWLVRLALPQARWRNGLYLLAWGGVVVAWLQTGALNSVNTRTSWLAAAVAQDPTWYGLTPRNLVLAVSYVIRDFTGLVLFDGMPYRYQGFTILLGLTCLAGWLHLSLRAKPRRPEAVFLAVYVLVPYGVALLAALATKTVVPLGTSYQLWSLPVLIVMFVELLWRLERALLRASVVLVIVGSFTTTIYSYNGRKNANPYDALLDRVGAANVTSIIVPRYYHAQVLFFHAGPRAALLPRILVDSTCVACRTERFVPHVSMGGDSIGRLNDEIDHSYHHRGVIRLVLADGSTVNLPEPLLFERAY